MADPKVERKPPNEGEPEPTPQDEIPPPVTAPSSGESRQTIEVGGDFEVDIRITIRPAGKKGAEEGEPGLGGSWVTCGRSCPVCPTHKPTCPNTCPACVTFGPGVSVCNC